MTGSSQGRQHGQARRDPLLWWGPTAKEMEVRVRRLYGDPYMAYVIVWGDGDWVRATPDTTYLHQYRRPGSYMVSTWTLNYTELLEQAHVVVREGVEPHLTVAPDAETDQQLNVTCEDDGLGVVSQYTIAWPGQDSETRYLLPGQTVSRLLPHGEHTFRITDRGTGRYHNYSVTLAAPQYVPDFTVAEDTADAERRTVKVTLTAVGDGKKPITVAYSDGTSDVIENPKVGDAVTHRFTPADDLNGDGTTGYFLVEGYFADGSGSRRRDYMVTIPYGSGEAA